MREAYEFFHDRGDVAFLNGYFCMYVDNVLYGTLQTSKYLYLGVDVFAVEQGASIDQSLSEYIKKHLPGDHYDSEGELIPGVSLTDFHFPLEDLLIRIGKDDDTLRNTLYSFFSKYANPDYVPEKLYEAIDGFIRMFGYSFFTVTGVYHADAELVKQLGECRAFFDVLLDVLLIMFGGYGMILTMSECP